MKSEERNNRINCFSEEKKETKKTMLKDVTTSLNAESSEVQEFMGDLRDEIRQTREFRERHQRCTNPACRCACHFEY